MMALSRCVGSVTLSIPRELRTSFCRNCASHHGPPDRVEPPGFLKRYLVDKVIDYVNKSSGFLEQTYPKVFQIFRTFKTGMTGFVSDARDYYSVTTALWAGTCLSQFSRRQLEIYREMPVEMLRVSPMLLIAAVPGGSGIFPLAYAFPKYLLSHHFWTQQQKADFGRQELQKRGRHFSAVLESLKQRSRHIDDGPSKTALLAVIRKLDHQQVVSVEEIMDIAPLFQAYPFHLDTISIAYVRHLAKAMRMSLQRSKLSQDALLLLHTDLAMAREGLAALDEDSLNRACFWRGLNPVELTRDEKLRHLQQWLAVSKAITEDNVSLLLHTPLFLFAKLPCNRFLWQHFALPADAESSASSVMEDAQLSAGASQKISAALPASSGKALRVAKKPVIDITSDAAAQGNGAGVSGQRFRASEELSSGQNTGSKRSFSCDSSLRATAARAGEAVESGQR